MRDAATESVTVELEAFVEAYETAQERAGQAELADFLPAPGHPLYAPILRELVRVDLEYGWQRGRPLSLQDYRDRFPALFADPASLEQIAFEEYRLRRQAGEAPSRAEYEDRYGLSTGSWPVAAEGLATSALADALTKGPVMASDQEYGTPAQSKMARAYRELRTVPAELQQAAGSGDHARLFSEVHGGDQATADRLAQVHAAMPEPGTTFQGFSLISELGRGTFGRVYLARQGDLANRLVAVKVSADLWGESQTLAQLQHTHIVPIYSLHRSGLLQAVCMPYLGSTTLADLLRDFQQRAALPETAIELESTLASRQPLARLDTVDRDEREGEAYAGPRTTGGRGLDRSLALPAPRPAPPWSSGVSYVDAVVAIAARLADGLAHAHERGILHRDLKPANVLLTGEGQPLLLDFNLSEDTKLRGALAPAIIGGTLAYMAPEHLDAFRTGRRGTDPRSDVYSLGVILFELLSGRQPFAAPRGPIAGIVPQLLAERRKGAPALRRWNRAISPAVESIVQHCLEPEPARRYQTARQLEDDLKRHLENRPLRHAAEPSLRERLSKWRCRHPRLTSAGAVAAIAGVVLLALLLALYARNQRLARLEAVESANRFRGEQQTVQFMFLHHRVGDVAGLAKAADRCRDVLNQYRVLSDSAWQDSPPVCYLPAGERQRLAEEVGDLLLLWSQVTALQAARKSGAADREGELHLALDLNERAERCFPAGSAPPALWRLRADLSHALHAPDDTSEFLRRAEDYPPTARNLASLARAQLFSGRYREALSLLQQARRLEPGSFWIWFAEGQCHEQLAQDAEAAACYSTCIALAPAFPPAYYKRGLAQLRLRRHAEALADFDESLRLDPAFALAYLDRALARLNVKQYAASIQDLSEALERGAPAARVYLMRARVRELAGDRAGADHDRRLGLRSEPSDEAGWIARGFAELPDAERALADFDKALMVNPHSLAALENKAYVLAEKLGRTEDAIELLNSIVSRYPDFTRGWAGRGVLWARLGKRAEALRDAEASLECSAEPAVLYQVAGIYALTSRITPDDRREALRLLTAALNKGYGRDLLETDGDLDPIRDSAEFQGLLKRLGKSGAAPR